MIKAIVFDFSRVLLFAKDPSYLGDLNPLHRQLSENNPDYPFFDNFYLNQELLDWLRLIHGAKLYIFTSGNIQNAPAIRPMLDNIFTHVYSAETMHLSKSDPAAYSKLCSILNRSPQDVLFIDDSKKNIAAAKQAGLQTLLFSNTAKLIKVLQMLK
ncbi:MAG: HAD-IA family hydrolase [Candidatus Saccharibacteria bacterium]|nr:HAD-IA family hydrolase [Candidatus Saccharibacteria bacterium]